MSALRLAERGYSVYAKTLYRARSAFPSLTITALAERAMTFIPPAAEAQAPQDSSRRISPSLS